MGYAIQGDESAIFDDWAATFQSNPQRLSW